MKITSTIVYGGLAFLFSFLSSGFSLSAQTGIIRGSVKTSDGKPAAAVNMLIKGTTRYTVTEENGSFTFLNLRGGAYTLYTHHPGLISQEKNIQLNDGEQLTLDFQLNIDARELKEVIVSGARTLNQRQLNIGKAGIDAKDLPQSIAIVDKIVLERQQVLHLSDALMNVNGVYVMGSTGGGQEELAGRGYAFNSSNTFKNGARFNNGAMPELSAVERVEVLKGSAAILYGNVSAGGILNLVTKKPKFEQGGEVMFRVGSYDFYKPSVDIYGALNNSSRLAYRVNTTYEKSGSFRDEVKAERFYINPSLLFKVSDKTALLLEGDFLKDQRTSDFGTGAINYVIADIPRSRFLGTPWSYYKTQQQSVTLTSTHHFNDQWQLAHIVAYSGYSSELFGTTRPNSGTFIQPGGKWIRGLQRSGSAEDYFLTQIDLTGNFSTGDLRHQLLMGADADKYQSHAIAYNGIPVFDSINIFDPLQYKTRQDVPELSQRTRTTSPVSRFGIYAQDLVSFHEKLKLLAGLRYSYQDTRSEVFTLANGSSTNSVGNDYAFSPRLGLIYQPLKTLSLFTSYSNSFTLNTGIDTSGNALKPSYINQYEVGLKSDLFHRFLSFNVTLYKIINSNLAQTSLANGNTNSTIKELAGEVTSKGLEVDVTSKPVDGLQLIAGYSYNDTRYTRSNIYIKGSKLRYNPAHTANASAWYQFQGKHLKGLNLGFTTYYIGERVAGRSTRLTVVNDAFKLMSVPDYFQFDASAGYTYQKVSVRVKLSNLLNKLSYYIHDDNSINPIAPRQFSTTVSFRL